MTQITLISANARPLARGRARIRDRTRITLASQNRPGFLGRSKSGVDELGRSVSVSLIRSCVRVCIGLLTARCFLVADRSPHGASRCQLLANAAIAPSPRSRGFGDLLFPSPCVFDGECVDRFIGSCVFDGECVDRFIGSPCVSRSAWSAPSRFTPRAAIRPATGDFQMAVLAGRPLYSNSRTRENPRHPSRHSSPSRLLLHLHGLFAPPESG